MEKKINILFVAFEFPPLGGGGVQRSLKFVKYLPQFGINPVVVTAKEEDYPRVMAEHPMDNSLMCEVPAGINIERIPCNSPAPARNKMIQWARIYFSIVENYKNFWYDELAKNLPAILEKYKPAAIYISLPPFAMAPLWLKLLFGNKVPLIVDFRDAWSQWCLAPNASFLHYSLKLQYEKRILDRANRVICSSNQIMQDMQRVHPAVNAAKYSVITSGYDDELTVADELLSGKNEKFIIGYVGGFYYTPQSRENIFKPWWKKPPHRMLNYVPRKEDWLYRSPWFFFKALRSMIDADTSLAARIEVRFAGLTPGWLKAQIKETGLENNCRHFGYLGHDEVISFQQNCDVLLLTSSKVIIGRDYSIAGKTFEYFSIGRPILAFVCEGAQKEILEETKMSVICNPDDTEGSAEKIHNLMAGNLVLHPDKRALEKYHRSKLTERLANLIKEMVN